MSITPYAAPVRPRTLVLAFWLLLASACLTVASSATAALAVFSPDGEAALRASLQATPGADVGELDTDTLVAVSQTTAVAIQAFLALVSVVIVLWIAFSLRAGRRYIRVVLTILAGLQVIAAAAAPTAVALISLVVVLAAVVLTWLPASSGYLTARTAARRAAPETVMVG
ncbi:MAG: hypothetical protein K0S70_4486 [Microbacterium sp.]|jgi:hypothetical protein|nr:hypothetical protein [Microbacterium sp.]